MTLSYENVDQRLLQCWWRKLKGAGAVTKGSDDGDIERRARFPKRSLAQDAADKALYQTHTNFRDSEDWCGAAF